MAQVNSLRQELQILASNRPVTIVTGRGAGTSKYGIIIVVVVVGYGYVWWKGWRLPMFATRRSLSEARDSIAKHLQSVHSSISGTRQQLSSRTDGVKNRLEEIVDITATTKDEASELQDRSKIIGSNLQSVRNAVQTLESKFNRLEGNQEMINKGVGHLCDHAVEQNRFTDRIQALSASSSRPALEAPVKTPSRTESLPPILLVEPPSSDSNGTPKAKRSPRNAVSAWSLKEVGGLSSPAVANGNRTSEGKTNGSSSSGFSGKMFSGGNGSLLTRTCSLTNAVPQEMGSSSKNL
ncbi:hypothetical protein PTKIN_Ptkin02bG0059700 [Pterospermum kingtungense]